MNCGNQNEALGDVILDQKRAKNLINLWMLRAHLAARAHYSQSNQLRLFNVLLTLFNAIASVGVLFFSNATWVKAIVGGGNSTNNALFDVHDIYTSTLAFLVVISTICQFMFRWAEQSHQHRFAGTEFANLQRKIERYSTLATLNMSAIHNISREYNHITKSYPLTSKKVWHKAGKERLATSITDLEDKLSETQ